jgi:hypothetical protein
MIVTAENGLVIRKSPNASGEKLGKLAHGTEVTIDLKTTHTQSVFDGGIEVTGHWVKISVPNWYNFHSQSDSLYVFDGYLKEKSDFLEAMSHELEPFSELSSYQIFSGISPFHLRADFFGDGVDDLVVFLSDSAGSTKLAFLNYGLKNEVHFLGNADDPFGIEDYSWAEVFRKVQPGDTMWSNYEDGFLNFEDVPDSKTVRLNYYGLYLHNSESCGGGFVYWRDEKFNWLQQE